MKISLIVLLLLMYTSVSAQDSLWQTYVDAGTKAYQEKRYPEAERRFDLARKEAESFGPNDPRRARTLCNLALVYVAQEKLADVKQPSSQALAIWGKTDWKERLDTEQLQAADILKTLSVALLKYKEYALIVVLLTKALELEVDLHEPEHPNIAWTLYYLAITNSLQNKPAEAKTFLQRSLKIFEKAKDKVDHTQILEILRNASTIDPPGAESYLKDALEFRAKNAEPEYNDIEILNLLADVYLNQREYEAAHEKLTLSLQIANRWYGPNDSHTVQAIKKLADAYAAAEDYKNAKSFYESGLKAVGKTPGDNRVVRFQMLNSLQSIYQLRGEYAEAEPLVEECLRIVEDVVGTKDPYFATYLNVKGVLLMDLEKYADAEQVLKSSLELREKLLKPNDPDLASSFNNVAKNLYYLGKYEQAEPFYLRAIDIARAVNEPSGDTLAWYNKNHALLLYAMGKNSQAEPIFRNSLGVFAKNENEISVSVSWYELAELYRRQKKYGEAGALFEKALTLMDRPKHDRRRLVVALQKYATLLRDTNREIEARRIETRARDLKAALVAGSDANPP